MKTKKEKFPYKVLRPEQVEELNSKQNEELMSDYLAQVKHVQVIKKMKKEDSKLQELKKTIKEHRDSSQELKDAKEEVKTVRESVDSEIEDEINDKKALEGGYRDQAKEHIETMHAIQTILERRKNI